MAEKQNEHEDQGKRREGYPVKSHQRAARLGRSGRRKRHAVSLCLTRCRLNARQSNENKRIDKAGTTGNRNLAETVDRVRSG
jgi:hypothetical protein